MTVNIKAKLTLTLVYLGTPLFVHAQENYGVGLFINGLLFFIALPIALIIFFIVRLALQEEDKPLGIIPSIILAALIYFIVHSIGIVILTP